MLYTILYICKLVDTWIFQSKNTRPATFGNQSNAADYTYQDIGPKAY